MWREVGSVIVGLSLVPILSPGAAADHIDPNTAESCLTPIDDVYIVKDASGNMHPTNGADPLVSPNSPDCAIGDFIYWSIAHDDKIRLGDRFELTSTGQNFMAIPLVLSVTYSVNPNSACSVTGFVSDSGPLGTDTVILAPKDQTYLDGGILWHDVITSGLQGKGTLPGTCSIQLSAVLSFLDETLITFGTASPTFEVKPALASLVNLGTVQADCFNERFTIQGAGANFNVLEGETDFVIASKVIDGCDRKSTVIINAKKLNNATQNHQTVLGLTHNGRTGTERDKGEKVSLAAGSHTFRVQAAYVNLKGFTNDCIAELAVLGFAIIVAVLIGGSTAGILLGVSAALVGGVMAEVLTGACLGGLKFSKEYFIHVSAEKNVVLQAPAP